MAGTRPYGFKLDIFKQGESSQIKVTDCVFYVNPPPITVTAWGGGGARTLVYNAVIRADEKIGYLKHVRENRGSSSGTLTAVLRSMPIQDPDKRQEVYQAFCSLDGEDVYGDSLGWRVYQRVTSVTYLVSAPLDWLKQSINYLSKGFSNAKPLTKILQGVSLVVDLASAVISPRTYAGLYNLARYGGFYRGESFKKGFQRIIHHTVEECIHKLLNSLNIENRKEIVNKLIEKGIFFKTTTRDGYQVYQVTTELTFNHFFELSKIFPGSFREIIITGVQLNGPHKPPQLVYFKRGSEYGDIPVYLAMRGSISIPGAYIKPVIKGKHFIDGGIIDNCPVDHESNEYEPHAVQKRFGVTREMSKLAISVEDADGLSFLWRNNAVRYDTLTLPRRLLKFFRHVVLSWLVHLVKLFTANINPLKTLEDTRSLLREKFPHRTLQLDDLGLGITDFYAAKHENEHYVERSMERPNDFIRSRCAEKVAIIQYTVKPDGVLEEKLPEHLSTVMLPREALIRLLVDLEDEKTIPSDSLFSESDASCNLTEVRRNLAKELRNSKVIRELKEEPRLYLQRLDSEMQSSAGVVMRLCDSSDVAVQALCRRDRSQAEAESSSLQRTKSPELQSELVSSNDNLDGERRFGRSVASLSS